MAAKIKAIVYAGMPTGKKKGSKKSKPKGKKK